MSVWAALPLLALLTANTAPPQAELDIAVEGLRSAKGMVRACMTRQEKFYLHCDKDPQSFHANISASGPVHFRFSDVPPGDYALALLHDENGNGKIDTMMGIPREGFAFSRNPIVLVGPPSFAAVRFHLQPGQSTQQVKMKYLF